MTYHLTFNQAEVVNFLDGSLLVIAGAGSGKTHVLTERVRNLVLHKKGHYRVLALTFTNKAAIEMKERLKDIKDLGNKAFIGTIHNFCMDILSTRGEVVGINHDFHIFGSEQDRMDVLKQVIESSPQLQNYFHQQSNQKGFLLRRILDYISRQKRQLIPPLTNEILSSSFQDEEKMFSYVYREYDNLLRSQNALDYDDLIFLTYRIFTERPAIARFYQKLYKYLCIDEAQDLNYSQYQLIKAFCGGNYKNIMMVGDPNQAIFGFIGASSNYMSENFKFDFNPKVIYLNENFRSAESIVKVAKKLEPTMQTNTTLPIKGAVELKKFNNELEEAQWVFENIKYLFNNGHPEIQSSIPFANMAVLGRNRYVLSNLEKLLKNEGIPYYTKLSDSFESESEFIKAFELGVRLIINPADRLHLQQLLNLLDMSELFESIYADKYESGIELLNQIAKEIKGEWLSHFNILNKTLSELTIKQPKFNNSLQSLISYSKQRWNKDEEILSLVINDLNMWKEKWDSYVRQTNIDSRNLIQFRNQVSMGLSQTPKEGIALLTIHTSKGLEFDVVHIMGMCDGTFPDYRAIKLGEEGLEEEKHNAFVAVTRARRVVYMTYPTVKQFSWGNKVQQPSRFLLTMGLI
ncbi:ATP-dependent helicase [Bacillus toyonensis]|uniref:ATP-dependent helicase n=1 Tax=Bacillus toyonensis TaxID=155322 RepID=UPI001C738E7D|nr:ATP-dependent helicase [Bacillus toyonensis]MBX0354993.1 ATP-dependent helicase [Bacillus toyonensis]